MLLDDQKVTCIADLLSSLSNLIEAEKETAWFRGQSDLTWKLLPSIARIGGGIQAEMALMKRFKQNAGPFLATRPTCDAEWFMLMQHHRVPTRLLDWTESPLVALYFAVSDNETEGQDGALWCLLPRRLNEHARITFSFKGELPALVDDDVVNNYLPPSVLNDRLTGVLPVAVIGARDTPRMYAQLGVFTLSHNEPIAIEDVGDGSHIGRLTIPAANKQTIKRELALLKVTRLTLFPELDNVAAQCREVLD